MAQSLGAVWDIFGDDFSVTFLGKVHAMAWYGMYWRSGNKRTNVQVAIDDAQRISEEMKKLFERLVVKSGAILFW
jgi:hypothetical protein